MKKRKYDIYDEPDQSDPFETTSRAAIQPRPKPPKKYFYEEPPQVDPTASRKSVIAVHAVKNATKRRRVWIEQPAPPTETKKKKSKKRGRLAGFIDLPNELLREVFQYFLPYDILIFSRLCKALRQVLMCKSVRYLWRQSLKNYGHFPACPPDWIEPRWLDLCLVPYCSFCLKSYVKKVQWRLRMRICNRCKRFRILERRKHNSNTLSVHDPQYPIHYLIPTEQGRRSNLLEFYIPDYQKAQKEFESSKDRVKYIMERREMLRLHESHASTCANWEKNRKHFHEYRLKDLKTRRVKNIIERLVILGYGDEIRQMRPPDSIYRHPAVNRPQIVTPRIWGQIKPQLLHYMEVMRQKRLQREHGQLVLERKIVVAEVLRKWKNKRLPVNEVLPNVLDFCEIGPVKEILQQPTGALVDESCFTPKVMLQVDYYVQKWQERLPFFLAERLQAIEKEGRTVRYELAAGFDRYNGGNFPLGISKIVPRLPLATTVFVCERCSSGRAETGLPDQMSPPRYQPLFFPEILDHKCFTRWTCPSSWSASMCNKGREPAARMGEYHGFRMPWDMTGNVTIDYHWQMARCIKKLINFAGLDHRTITAQEMSERDDWFACPSCVEDLDARTKTVKTVAFKWKQAAQHWIEEHLYLSDLEWVCYPHETITEAHEEYIGHGEEPSDATKKFQEAHYACARCRDLPTERPPAPLLEIYQHLSADHKQQYPVENKDYYLLFEDRYIEAGAFDVAFIVEEPEKEEEKKEPKKKKRRKRRAW